MHIPILHRWLARLWERWAERGASDFPSHAAAARLRYGYNSRYKWTLASCFVLVACLCYYGWTQPQAFRDDPALLLWFVRIALAATVVIGIGEVAHAFRWSASVTESELVIRRTFGREERIRWSDIYAITDDMTAREIRVFHADGESRISFHVNGARDLRRRLEAAATLE